ncbi:TetR/AcrR family transcriptional regulator [Labrys okinawensis]|uniref:TetR/AcrR family transcriptional regulator n=1 Tax=Labrys okinawensis TaxID=346911 RepID=UPI0039BC4F37
MARPREFDEEAVLDAAMQCFWEQGYEATSVRDLATRMGMTGASLYNAFGDKRALYRRSLDFYTERSFGERTVRLEASLPPREAIIAFYREIIELSLGDPKARGCMMVNSALEAGPRDPEFRAVVAEVLGRIQAFFHRCVLAGQRDGSIPLTHDAEDLARFFLSVQLGLRVLARTAPRRDELEGALRPALALLGSEDYQEVATTQ